MKVRGKRLLAAILSVVMVLSLFCVPATAGIGNNAWDFSTLTKDDGSSYSQNDPLDATLTGYDGLTLNSVKYHSTSYGVTMGNGGSIDISVPGDCDIKVAVGYQWSLQLGDDAGTLKTNPDNGTAELVFHYTGPAGTASLKATGTSYIKTIALAAATAPEPTLTLDKTLVELKLDDKPSDTVTATVGNSTGAVQAVSSDTAVATVSVADEIITITAQGDGDATVTVTVDGTDLSKVINVHVDPAGEVTYTEWDFSAQSYQGHTSIGTADAPDTYQNLSIVGGKFHSAQYGMTIKNGSIAIPVTGKCDINVVVGYTWELWLGDDETTKVSFPSGNGGENNEFTFSYTGEAGTATLTVGAATTTYIKSIKLTESVDLDSRKIDVWDFGGKEESDADKYVNHITPADWVSANVITSGAGIFAADGNITFGDVTINVKAKDRLYSSVDDAAFKALLGGYAGTAYAKTIAGYAAAGGWYCNGNGGNSRRYVTVKTVAGDKVVAYLGSTGSNSTIYHFEGQGQDDSVTLAPNTYEKVEFAAKESGTYKLWAEATDGQAKPMYFRVVRMPGVKVTGSITFPSGANVTGYTVKFVNQTNKQETEATVANDGTFTVTLAPGYTYTATLSGATGWGFSDQTKTVTTTDDEALTGKTGVDLDVVQKVVYTFSGSITGLDADADVSKLSITMTPGEGSNADPVELTINADKSFTATLEADVVYTPELMGVNDYQVKAPKAVTSSSAAVTQNIELEKKAAYTASGKFIGLDGKAISATVTALTFENVDDGYTYAATITDGGYSVSLRDGAYAAKATVTGLSTKTHVVVSGADVTKDLLFTGAADTSAVTWTADVYVGYPDKSPNYDTVNAAVNAISRMGVTSEAKRVTVHIAPGTYREQIIINTPYITFKNDDPAQEVLLTWYYGIGYVYYSSSNGFYNAEAAYDKYEKGIADRWGTTVQLKSGATAFRAEGITFENSFNRYITAEEIADGVEPGGGDKKNFDRTAANADVTSKAATERATAMCVEANQVEFFNCSFLSSQDTLYTQGNAYFKDCFIEGETDYIFGSGNVIFDACELSWKGYSDASANAGYITASRPNDIPGCKGYLFRDCTVTGNDALTVPAGYWGRTWGANAMVTLLNTKLASAGLILPVGWYNMNGDPKNANYHEYNTTLNGAAVDTSKRTEGTVMTAAEAEAVKDTDYLGSWVPYYYDAEAPVKPAKLDAVAGSWFETIFVEVKGIADADVTAVSWSGAATGSLTGDDLKYLVRDMTGGVRIDIPGLKAGTYDLKLTVRGSDYTFKSIVVEAHDRSGFAHFNYTDGVGAYNDDGTLKDNAVVLYVTDENKDTVTLTVNGKSVSGIGNILNTKGYKDTGAEKILHELTKANKPLVVRIIGDVTAPAGVTAKASTAFGGNVKDNGGMCIMQNAKDITIEGIGMDATVNGWGFSFNAGGQSDGSWGKNFEVRNIAFRNVPEDCIGIEGKSSNGEITEPAEHIWVHNCEFYVPSISDPAEKDKAQGDGAVDFKCGRYMTMSYCYFEGYHKTSLLGGGDEQPQYHVTWHHNYWKNCESRSPLARQADVHIYNNLYDGHTSYCMSLRANTYIFSEFNTFQNCNNPVIDEGTGGVCKSYEDVFTNCKGKNDAQKVTDKTQTVTSANKYANFDTDATLSYIPSGSYKLDSLAQAKENISLYNGVMNMPKTLVKPEGSTSEPTPTVTVTGVSLSITELELVVGEATDPLTATVTVTPDAAENKAVTWASSNTAVATVSANGVVTAKAAGTATITATSVKDGTKKATCVVTVTIASTGGSTEPVSTTKVLDANTMAVEDHSNGADTTVADYFTIKWGDKGKIQAGSATFEGDDYKGVNRVHMGGATKNLDGRVINFTTTSANATIKVWYKTGKSSSGTKARNIAIFKGDIGTIVAQSSNTDANEDTSFVATYTLADPAAYSLGIVGDTCFIYKVEVTETTAGGSDTPTVSITGVSLDKTTLSLSKGSTAELKATIEPENATTNKTLTWSSSDTAVATVDQNGTVTAVKAGTATITVTTKNGKKATCAITVTSGSGSQGGGSSDMVPTGPSGSKTETVTNPDGSKTTTKTDRKGNTTVTTVAVDGSKVEVFTTKAGDKTITVTDAKGEVQAAVELPAAIPAPKDKFTDVPEGHWAESAINDMAGLGIVQGVSAGIFDMASPITRGSVATILFRLSHGAEGKPNSFTDVNADDWYADAVAWANSTGVVTGYSDTLFGPKDSIDRQQFAVMLYRYAGLLGLDTTAKADLNQFGDAANVSDWAADALGWCVEKGILKGTGYGDLNPKGVASRAECAAMLGRFIGLL